MMNGETPMLRINCLTHFLDSGKQWKQPSEEKLLELHRRKQDSTCSTELTTGETSMSTSMETSDSETGEILTLVTD